jgi:ABC-type nitrate/sulfonate/bicarbonate transport system substrate-binding protein
MGRRFSRAIGLTSVGLLVAMGAGCGSTGGNGAPAGLEKTTLTVGAVPVADEAGLYIAQDEGLFKAEGLTALKQGQEIADTDRAAVEQAMEKLPPPYTVAAPIAAVMSLENYPLSVSPDIDLARVQRVADAMYQFHMLAQPFQVKSMLG